MKLLPFAGYLVPGLHFKECSIWILNWMDTPTSCKKITEIWELGYDGSKICYIDPPAAVSIFERYHRFDKVIPVTIQINEQKHGIILTANGDREFLMLKLNFRNSVKYWFLNLLLTIGSKNKLGDKGLTETGKFFHNQPKKLLALTVDEAVRNGVPLELLKKPSASFDLGDGKPAAEPLLNYCTHMLEA